MAKYLASVNQKIASVVGQIPQICLYGQNLNKGTFISGLTRGLEVEASGRIVNMPNCENTLCGMGFGMMMAGAPCVYFVKQQDFMVLGIDHFVNTFNFIRCSRDHDSLGSFSIIMLVCDQGLQGPQSSFNNMGDFCSIARVPCYTLTNRADAEYVLSTQVGAPGFRMIGVSMRMRTTELLELEAIDKADDGSVFHYTEGDGATIVCFNFSLGRGHELHEQLLQRGVSSSLFSVNYLPSVNWDTIKQSVAATGKLVVMDDSKSVNLLAYKLIDSLDADGLTPQRIMATRGNDIVFGMTEDRYEVDVAAIASQLCSPASSSA